MKLKKSHWSQALHAALAIEFRERSIAYLREPHLEVFYRGQCIALDRPDFVVWTDNDGVPGLLLEVKQADRIVENSPTPLPTFRAPLAAVAPTYPTSVAAIQALGLPGPSKW